jgi:putative oxidoreductase
MFPEGLPGIALVLLRVSVALTVLHHVYLRQEVLPAWFLATLLLLAAMLVVGFLTPIVALLAMAVQLIGPAGLTLPNVVVVTASTLNALALALLGPGAYSLDALRFGRRVVDLPSAEDE